MFLQIYENLDSIQSKLKTRLKYEGNGTNGIMTYFL